MPGAPAHIVALHGMQAPGGQLSGLEILAASDPSLAKSAVAWASKWQGGLLGEETENGATPQSHEIIMTVECYVPGQ